MEGPAGALLALLEVERPWRLCLRGNGPNHLLPAPTAMQDPHLDLRAHSAAISARVCARHVPAAGPGSARADAAAAVPAAEAAAAAAEAAGTAGAGSSAGPEGAAGPGQAVSADPSKKQRKAPRKVERAEREAALLAGPPPPWIVLARSAGSGAVCTLEGGAPEGEGVEQRRVKRAKLCGSAEEGGEVEQGQVQEAGEGLLEQQLLRLVAAHSPYELAAAAKAAAAGNATAEPCAAAADGTNGTDGTASIADGTATVAPTAAAAGAWSRLPAYWARHRSQWDLDAVEADPRRATAVAAVTAVAEALTRGSASHGDVVALCMGRWGRHGGWKLAKVGCGQVYRGRRGRHWGQHGARCQTDRKEDARCCRQSAAHARLLNGLWLPTCRTPSI